MVTDAEEKGLITPGKVRGGRYNSYACCWKCNVNSLYRQRCLLAFHHLGT